MESKRSAYRQERDPRWHGGSGDGEQRPLFEVREKFELRGREKNKTSERPLRSDGESGSARGRRDRNAAAPLLLSKKKKSLT